MISYNSPPQSAAGAEESGEGSVLESLASVQTAPDVKDKVKKSER